MLGKPLKDIPTRIPQTPKCGKPSGDPQGLSPIPAALPANLHLIPDARKGDGNHDGDEDDTNAKTGKRQNKHL